MLRNLLLGLTVLGVFTATVLVYYPGLRGPMVFDDLTNIVLVQQVRITEITPDSLIGAMTAVPQGPFGRPLSFLTFALNHYFTGIDPYYFKLTNLFIHIVAATLLWYLAVRLLRQQVGEALPARRRAWVALFAFAIWALHPINLTSVLYVVQRMTGLASVLTVAGLLGYVIGRQQVIDGKARGFSTMALSLILFGTLATLAKENGVLIFAYAFVIEVVFFRFAVSSTLTPSGRWLLIFLFALPLAVGASVLITHFDILAGPAAYAPRSFDLYERLLTEARALWFYLRLIVIPDTMSLGLYHDDFSISKSLLNPSSTLPAVFGILTLLGIAIASIRRAPMLSFAILWFFAGHSIESSIFPLELVHEHRNYLPSFGIVLALVYYVLHPNTDSIVAPRVRYGALAIYCLLASTATFTRSTHWASEWALFNKEVLNHPNSSRAHSMLGILYHDNKLYPAAEQEFLIAAQLNRTSAEPVIQLAQHQYIAKGGIDPYVLEELEDRLMSLPINSVTLWVMEPLIRSTQKDKQLNRKLLDLYTAVIHRSDINISSDWLGAAAANIASGYNRHGDTAAAAKLYGFATKHRPLPSYLLSLAEIELKRGHRKAASQALARIKSDDLSLEQKRQIELLSKQLSSKSGTQ